MAHRRSLAQTFAYTRALVEASVAGARAAGTAADSAFPAFTSAARGALKAAAVAAGIGLLASSVRRSPSKRAVRNAFALGGITFCTDLCWRSRTLASHGLAAFRKQVSDVRDQRWLELNPIDYA